MPEVTPQKPVRLDKWLWAVRIFKTRSLATQACRKGSVMIGGRPVRPSRDVKIDDVIVVEKDDITRTLKVLRPLDHRVGAPIAKECFEDKTPPSEYEKARAAKSVPRLLRPRGAGRPTKKERRAIDWLLRPPPGND